ncbi:MAG: Dabb family protein [Bacteroidaceae bacterium]|nr:Dabb family protein [Bacteroidaceae bacterium]
MVRHVILWKLNEQLSEEEKQNVKAGIKSGLESLVGKVPGLLDVKVHIDGRLASSNADVMLDSLLESAEALKAYSTHPEHVAVANGKVRPYTVQRTCLDFEVE